MTDIDTSVDSGTAAASDDPLVDQVHRHYNEAFDHSKEWREKARQDYDFYVGEQWDADDKLALEGQDRPIITFNYIQMIVDAVVGVEINNRQESRYIPRELGDVKINEIYSGVASHAEDEGDTEDEESDAFQDLVICGMGWTETRMSYDFDPMGDLIPSERFDPLEGYWDPTARKKNIVDSRWRLRIKAMDRKEAEAVWPKIKDIAGEATGAPWDRQADTATGEPREHIYPQDAYELSKDQSRQHQKNRNIIRVGQYQWVEFEPVMIVHNEIKGEIETLTMEQWGKVKAIVEEAGWKHLRQRQKRFKQCFVAGRLLLEEGQCPDPEFFTLHCMTGKRDRNKNYWYGLVRNSQSPQRWTNKFMSLILEYIGKNAKGGLMAEKGAFEDVRKAEEEWSRPDSIIEMSEGALQKGKVEPKPRTPLPAEVQSMMSFSVESIRAVSGVNLEFLGMADRDQPGVLEFHRKQAAINVIASFFDGLRKYRKERARCVLHFIREYVPDGKIIRIMGEKGIEQFVKFVKDPAIEDFDVIVDESPQSPNQRDRTFAILREMIPGLIQAGVPIPPEILDYAPLPSGLVAAWKKMIVERTQGDPAQKQLMQQMAQLETALKQATISKTEAEAERAAADAEKKRAEVEKVEAETDLTEVRAAVEPSRALPNPPTQRAAE